MSVIERVIQVNYRHRVYFTQDVFQLENGLLQEVLTEDQCRQLHKVLVVVDECLAKAQPELCARIQAYFAALPQCIHLVCPPMVIEGGERSKNSDMHIAEI